MLGSEHILITRTTKEIITPFFVQGEWLEEKMQIPIVMRRLSINRKFKTKRLIEN